MRYSVDLLLGDIHFTHAAASEFFEEFVVA
jgi:hypothetical protein